MTHIEILIKLIIFVVFTSCQAEKEKSCVATNKPLEVSFGDSSLEGIQFSPFEKGKVWVRAINQNVTIWEIDNSSGQKIIIDEPKSKFFFSDNYNGYLQYCHKDQYDSLVWLGEPYKNVVFYDERSKTINELPVRHVTRIISKPNEVFFVSFQGFCYWDRKTKSILQVPDIPLQFIQNYVMPDDTTITLDNTYTYFFNSKTVKRGIFLGNYKYEGRLSSYKATDGLGTFSKKDSVFYIYDGVSKVLPLPSTYIGDTKIIDKKYWQTDLNFYYSFDPKLEAIKKFHYRLPYVNNHVPDYQVDSKYIWINRPGQVMLLDMSDNKQLEFPIQADERHIRTIFDECNVYSLYKDKLLVMSKDDFIKRCVPFDAKAYDFALGQLNFVIDSLGMLKDSVPSSVLLKLNHLKERYANTNHLDIIQRLSGLDTGAFQSIPYKFPSGYVQCYKDKSMPVSQRKSCLKLLIERYGRSSNFNTAVNLEQEFIRYFGQQDRETDYYFFSAIDSVKRYLSIADSLTKLNLSSDSLFYFKSLALESICQTRWYCGPCGGCDLSLVKDNLKALATKFPKSQLIDNAMLYIINVDYMYNYDIDEDGFLMSKNKKYEEFLKKYPESDMRSDVLYYIFMNWASMQVLNHKKIKSTAQRFIDEFAYDKRIVEVKQKLNKLKIE